MVRLLMQVLNVDIRFPDFGVEDSNVSRVDHAGPPM